MPSALYSTTLSAFRAQGWAFRPVSGLEVIEADFEAHHTKVPLHVQVYDEAGVVSVVARAGFPVPASHRLAACELLMRTNKELNVGNFEIDWDHGTVMYRTTNIFPAGQADPRIIAGLVHTSVAEVDRLTPFLGEICRTPTGELLLLDIPRLMQRHDLLPPPPETMAAS
ncbi:MAG: YbjN domain-containing protein [Prosthecobacter sp.]|nr:YbjN domain-containing protein [Prosthecobacter sp.]